MSIDLLFLKFALTNWSNWNPCWFHGLVWSCTNPSIQYQIYLDFPTCNKILEFLNFNIHRLSRHDFSYFIDIRLKLHWSLPTLMIWCRLCSHMSCCTHIGSIHDNPSRSFWLYSLKFKHISICLEYFQWLQLYPRFHRLIQPYN